MRGFHQASILPNPHRQRLPVWVYLPGMVLVCLLFMFFRVGQWLVVQDALEPAAAIAVLSGRMPERALEAARVYKQGYANRVWLTHSREPGATMAKLSIPYIGEEDYNRQILIHEGVPGTAINVLDPPIVNTADEMQTIGEALRKEQSRTVILVTSAVHTRRTKTLWKRISAQDGTALVHAVSHDDYDGAHWWRTTRDALDVVRELLGIANAWANLPLRPSH